MQVAGETSEGSLKNILVAESEPLPAITVFSGFLLIPFKGTVILFNLIRRATKQFGLRTNLRSQRI